MGKCILAGHPQAGGQIGYGTYAGDGQNVRKISLGVTPKWVLVFMDGYITFGGFNTGSSGAFGGLALSGNPVKTFESGTVLEVVSGGFRVYYSDSSHQATNMSQRFYNYLYGY